MRSVVIRCAQQLLIALHGGDLRLSHISHPTQILISPISHTYAEEFKSQHGIMIRIGHRLHVHSNCIGFFSCLVENEQLTGWPFGADFRPKSMFSRAHSPATHHNCRNTSVKHASHHHTCSWWIWKHEDYSVWNATNWLTWVSAPWFLSLASKLGGIPMCLLFNNTLCFLFCCWSCTTLLYHPSSIGSCCDRRVAAMSIRGNDAGSRIANTNVLFP